MKDLKLALDQTLRDVMENAFEPLQVSSLEIYFDPLSVGLEVIIHHYGLPSENLETQACRLFMADSQTKPASEGSACSRGLIDRFSLRNLGPKGNAIHMVKFFDKFPETPLSSSSARDSEPLPQIPNFDSTAAPYRVKPFDPKDALGVSRSAYLAYGYSYDYPEIYNPEVIRKRNLEGQQVSIVASSRNNEVIGHNSIWKSLSHVDAWEMGMAFVQPNYRRLGCLKTMTKVLLDRAEEMKIPFIFVQAVTGHVFSQEAAKRLGFKTSGLRLCRGAQLDFKKLEADSHVRHSFLLMVRLIESPPKRKLIAPGIYMDLLNDVYRNLEIPVIFSTLETEMPDLPPGCGWLDVSRHDYYAATDVKILSVGMDTIPRLKTLLIDLRRRKIENVSLWLSLADPAAVSLVDAALDMGFVFSGVLPDASAKDWLILQQVETVEIAFDQIHIYSDFGRSLFDHLRQNVSSGVSDDTTCNVTVEVPH
jgi:serine/threonine-protein kinase RsbW